MLSFFKQIYQYSYEMNLKQIRLLREQPIPPPDAIRLMSHIIHASQVWYSRIDGTIPSPPVWEDIPVEELETILNQDKTAWDRLLDSLADNELENIINYKNTKGDSFSSKLSDIIFHAANHATHHRAQISRIFRENGIAPPVTDYIFYIRER